MSMNDINSITVTGRLVADAERKDFSNSTKHSFRIAVQKSVKRGDRWENETSYFDVEAWNLGKVGEWLTKGKQVAINGDLATSEWEKDGQKKSKVFIHCQGIQIFSFGEKTEKPAKSSDDDDFPPF